MNPAAAPFQTLLTGFRSFLQAQGYHGNTVRNYLADINKFLSFSSSTTHCSPITDHLSITNLLNYLQQISNQNNSQRFLASLKLFCQYALNQKLINHNPLPDLIKHLHRQPPALNLNQLLKLYQLSLEKKNMSPATIKNYLNDLHQFINWSHNIES